MKEDLIKRLFSMQDMIYRDFHAKLIPEIDKDKVIGVRTPVLRTFAKEFANCEDKEDFLNSLPHTYYEENNLHAFLIEQIKDYDELVYRLDIFLPHVDNWATCDMMRPKIFKKHTDKLLSDIKRWIKSDDTYTVRFGLEMLMVYYLDDEFKEEYLLIAAGVNREEYYIKMMVAWYFATALAKQYDSAVKYIENCCLEKWTHNKAIQKSVESYRISKEKKEYLRSLKIK